MHAWLWKDQLLVDIAVRVEFYKSYLAGIPHLCRIQRETAFNVHEADTIRTPQFQHICNVVPTSDSHLPVNYSGSSSDQAIHPVATRTFLLHSPVLGSGSLVFQSCILSDTCPSPRKHVRDEHGCRLYVALVMDSAYESSIDTAFQFLYKHQLEEDLSGPLLLELMQIGYQWQSPQLTIAASTLLCSRTITFPITLVYLVPECLISNLVYKAVRETAAIRLLETYGNVLEIISDSSLHKQFQTLPHLALTALFQNPDLTTDSEDSVLLLFSDWCQDGCGRTCTKTQVQEVNRHIRYSRLSNPLTSGILGSLHVPQLDAKQLLEVWEVGKLPAEMCKQLTNLCSPSEWYLPPRRKPVHHSGCKLTLSVPVMDLVQMLDGNAGLNRTQLEFYSHVLYSEGFMWKLKLYSHNGDLWFVVDAYSLSTVSDIHAEVIEIEARLLRHVKFGIDNIVGIELFNRTVLIGSKTAGVKLTSTDSAYDGITTDENWWTGQQTDTGHILFYACVA